VVNLHLIIKGILIMVGWGTVLGTVALHTLYERTLRLLLPPHTVEWPFGAVLRPLDLLLMFLVCMLVGMILLEPERIVIGYVGALLFSGLLMFTALSLPATLNTIKFPALREFLYGASIEMTFRSLILGPVVICLMGAVLGGIVGERIS